MLATLTSGMIFDLTRFPGEDEQGLAAIETLEELDHYTYLVAGCVGPFWTVLHVTHRKRLGDWALREMSEEAVSFGKALQLTNVLRDVPGDLANGRCYLPGARAGRPGARAARPARASRRGPRAARCIAGWSGWRSSTTTSRGTTRSRSRGASGECGWRARGRC